MYSSKKNIYIEYIGYLVAGYVIFMNCDKVRSRVKLTTGGLIFSLYGRSSPADCGMGTMGKSL